MPAFLPHPDSIGSFVFPPGSGIEHTHSYDELCLVDDTATTFIHAGRPRAAPPGTLFALQSWRAARLREQARQSPRLWVIHFHRDEALAAALPGLLHADPDRRVWRLGAESGWLRLLHVAVARWNVPGYARERDGP